MSGGILLLSCSSLDAKFSNAILVSTREDGMSNDGTLYSGVASWGFHSVLAVFSQPGLGWTIFFFFFFAFFNFTDESA